MWDLSRICNQLIHSFIFHLIETKGGGLQGLMVASDHQRSKGLVQLHISDLLVILRSVAEDDIVSSRWQRDPKTGKESHALSNTLLPGDTAFPQEYNEEGEQVGAGDAEEAV